MFKILKRVSFVICAVALIAAVAVPAVKSVVYAADENRTQIVEQADKTVGRENTENSSTETTDDAKGSKAIAAGICVGLAAALGALAMGLAIAKSNEAIARQPEATSQIKSGLMLGLVFIETAIIYALIVAILVIFVL